METIIQEFLEKILELKISDGLANFLIKGMMYCHALILAIAEYRIEELDQLIFENRNIRHGYKVVRKADIRTLETKQGPLTFKRRYYYSKTEGYKYLTDSVIGIDSYERIEKSLSAELCLNATDTSYAKSSKAACSGRVSKQTVMQLLRKVEEKPIVFEATRSHIKEIHLQCDEDHVSMQDGSNTIVKLVTIHEAVVKIANSKKNRLSNKYTITSQTNETNESYWYRILDKINEKYGIRDKNNKLTVYIHGDGAFWIKAGIGYVPNSYYILDKFHFKKAVAKVSGHNEDYINFMWDAVKTNDLTKVKDMVDIFVNSEICSEEVANDFMKYYLNNFDGIKIWQRLGPKKSSSCAEGLVSHMLSARLSSRPKGWGTEGLDAVSRLRIHVLNGGKITASDFTKQAEKIELPLIKPKEIRQNKKRNYDFAPLITNACRRTKRDGLYHLFESIAESGYKF